MTTNACQSYSSPLLSLPAELRNRIYRDTFGEAAVTVTSTIFPEPPLLSVNKQIRQEAATIFYSERIFEVDTSSFSSDARITSNKKKSSVSVEFGIKIQHKLVGGSGPPHWRNFLTTLRRAHKGSNLGETRTVVDSMSMA